MGVGRNHLGSNSSGLADALIRLKQSRGKEEKLLAPSDYLHTGSTLLNLALTGSTSKGYAKGRYYYYVGDTSSGKTWVTMGALAEATLNPNFNEHRLIFDNGEDGALMNVRKYFGKKLEDRLEPPRVDKHGNPTFSTTIEEFYYHLDDARDEGRPFIYILDSMDVLDAKDNNKKFKERKEAYRKGKESKGDYGDGKAKINSGTLRKFMKFLKQSGSILIIISQTRDNIGFGSMFNPQTRSGGRVLSFLATCEMWTSVKGSIKKTINKKERKIGMVAKIAIKKNRQTGQDHSILVPFYNSIGIDDVGGCISYLIAENHWSGSGIKVKAKEFDFDGTIEDFAIKIQEEGLEKKLKRIVKSVWDDIQTKMKVKRRSRYE